MRPILAGASAVLLAVVLLTTSFCMVSDDSDAVYVHDGKYGKTVEANSAEIASAIETATGKTFDQWIAELSADLEHYDINTFTPDFKTEISMRRDVTVDDQYYNYYDHYAGYFDLVLDSDVSGYFPAPATYQRNQGELVPVFLYRVFAQEGDSNTRDTHIHLDLHVYFDLSIESKVDVTNNKLVSSLFKLRMSVHEAEDNNISLYITQNDNGELDTLTIAYDQTTVKNMFYLNLEVEFTIDDAQLHRAEPLWQMSPLAVEHVNRFVVSSDLANGVWGLVLDSLGDDAGNMGLPALIIKLLGSGSRMLDLFDTITSLTSAEMPDMGFTCGFTASDFNDGKYDYCRLKDPRENPSEGIYNIAWNGYHINFGQMVWNLPDSIFPVDQARVIEAKTYAYAILGAMGLNDVDVADISNDPTTEAKCNWIEDYVNETIDKDEVTSYHIPELYIYLSAGGIILAAAVFILLLRLRR